MAKHLVIAVDWYGPYPGLEAARLALNTYDWLPGLYMAIGKSEERPAKGLQYIGISKKLVGRVHARHATLAKISDLQIWLGEVGTANPSGKKLKKTAPTLDYAEWLSAFFLKLPLNNKKKANSPKIPVSLLNRWWKVGKTFDVPRVQRPNPEWPDFIDFLGRDYTTRIVWFGGKVQRRDLD
jgi:hypothetical protein